MLFHQGHGSPGKGSIWQQSYLGDLGRPSVHMIETDDNRLVLDTSHHASDYHEHMFPYRTRSNYQPRPGSVPLLTDRPHEEMETAGDDASDIEADEEDIAAADAVVSSILSSRQSSVRSVQPAVEKPPMPKGALYQHLLLGKDFAYLQRGGSPASAASSGYSPTHSRASPAARKALTSTAVGVSGMDHPGSKSSGASPVNGKSKSPTAAGKTAWALHVLQGCVGYILCYDHDICGNMLQVDCTSIASIAPLPSCGGHRIGLVTGATAHVLECAS